MDLGNSNRDDTKKLILSDEKAWPFRTCNLSLVTIPRFLFMGLRHGTYVHTMEPVNSRNNFGSHMDANNNHTFQSHSWNAKTRIKEPKKKNCKS
jgi:hypothetical protein